MFSDVRHEDGAEFYVEPQKYGESMYEVPLNELDDEIKAQIYNPTDPDCQSAHEQVVKPFQIPRQARPRKVNNYLNTGVTKKTRNLEATPA